MPVRRRRDGQRGEALPPPLRAHKAMTPKGFCRGWGVAATKGCGSRELARSRRVMDE